ncbi:MAG: hypothetical protein JW934_04220 [Anaerolineae bacterium]|nr:hypothetical protein [Anaerolineae bacterium]
MKRLAGLDLVRGVGILCVVFLHSATFHYAAISEVNFDDPPLVITVIGFLLMWAGLFAILSSAAYAYSSAVRVGQGNLSPVQIAASYAKAGLLMLVLHYVYFLALAPKLLDVEGGNHQFSLLPGLIATGRFPPFYSDRVFYSTALSMTAWNLLLIGPLVGWLLKRGRGARHAAPLLGGLGTLVVVLSLIRLPMYPVAAKSIEDGRWLAALIFGFLFNKNNPVLPYLGFGLFGSALGLALAGTERPRRALGWFALLGALWLAAGIVGLALLPDTMLEREVDLFWYFIVLFQLGLFLLLVVLALYLFDYGPDKLCGVLNNALKPARRVGAVSLSIFMLETVFSQIGVRIADALLPGWSLSINACLLFGAINALLWVGIVWVWSRAGFRYGMEWLSVRAYKWLRRPSDKMRMGEFL